MKTSNCRSNHSQYTCNCPSRFQLLQLLAFVQQQSGVATIVHHLSETILAATKCSPEFHHSLACVGLAMSDDLIRGSLVRDRRKGGTASNFVRSASDEHSDLPWCRRPTSNSWRCEASSLHAALLVLQADSVESSNDCAGLVPASCQHKRPSNSACLVFNLPTSWAKLT